MVIYTITTSIEGEFVFLWHSKAHCPRRVAEAKLTALRLKYPCLNLKLDKV